MVMNTKSRDSPPRKAAVSPTNVIAGGALASLTRQKSCCGNKWFVRKKRDGRPAWQLRGNGRRIGEPINPREAPLRNKRPPALPGGEELASLAARVRDGERSAEDTLVDLFYERVRLVVLYRIRDTEAARELAQDVLMAVVTALRHGGIHDGEKLTAFVYGTARNHMNSYFRSSARRPGDDTLVLDYPAAPAADPIESAERAALVRQALATLEANERKILLLTLVDGMKPGDIARRLGLSDEVVRARKSRAIKKVALLMHKLSRK